MRSLYLTHSHGQLGLDGEQVVVRCDQEELKRVPLPQLDQILVHGNVQLTTPLIRACLERQVSVAFFSHTGWCQGRMHPIDRGYRHRMRHQQMLSPQDRQFAALPLIRGKIINARVLLLRLTRRQRRAEINDALQRLGWLLSKLKGPITPERLRGLEGNAALEYQRALGVLLAENGFLVVGRTTGRPPARSMP